MDPVCLTRCREKSQTTTNPDWRVRRERPAIGRAKPPYSPIGIGAGRTFDVYGKDAQHARAALVHAALERGVNLFATAPSRGEGERILAAGLLGIRHRAYVMIRYDIDDEAAVHSQIDRSLHLFDGWIDVLLVDWILDSESMRLGMERMRQSGDATTTGFACQTVSDLSAALPVIMELELDVVSIPATLLLHGDTDALLERLSRADCDIIVRVPDGLESIAASESGGERALKLTRYRLSSYRDVLLKIATSDPRVTAVTVPVRRIRDLDKIEEIAATPDLTRTEIMALRTA